jgi:hypothetical protein
MQGVLPMKKSMLCAGLMTILSATAYAEDSGNQISAASSNELLTATKQEMQLATASTQVPAPGTQTPATGAQAPATSTQAPATGTQAPATGTQAPATGTQAPATGTKTPAAVVTKPQPLNCSYRIPADTTHIEQTIVKKWAEKAAEQSFEFDFKTIDNQISKLKSCYTDQGWQGFNDALEKSGNLNAIKSQQLTVSSMVNGESKVTDIKENQWKVTIPMQVVYQNDKEKLTQPLTVDLVVGRKVSGDLGIIQMIAIPRQTGAGSPATTPAKKP